MWAVLEGHTSVVSYLVRRQCEVNLLNAEGESAVMLGVRKKHVDIVRLLVELGQADISVRYEVNTHVLLHIILLACYNMRSLIYLVVWLDLIDASLLE